MLAGTDRMQRGREGAMPGQIPTGDIHHLRLTVTDPERVGLDHLSFGVAGRADLEQAIRLFDENGVPHGEITTLAGFGIDVLPFEDPDGVQLELTAPTAQA